MALRSSAAEYLTFVASTGNCDESFEMRYEDENIWLTQKMMAALYDVSKQTISQHIQRIYDDGELVRESTVRKYLTVQTEGSRRIDSRAGRCRKRAYGINNLGRCARRKNCKSGCDHC